MCSVLMSQHSVAWSSPQPAGTSLAPGCWSQPGPGLRKEKLELKTDGRVWTGRAGRQEEQKRSTWRRCILGLEETNNSLAVQAPRA